MWTEPAAKGCVDILAGVRGGAGQCGEDMS